jgi:hypothetical protein
VLTQVSPSSSRADRRWTCNLLTKQQRPLQQEIPDHPQAHRAVQFAVGAHPVFALAAPAEDAQVIPVEDVQRLLVR